MQYLISSQQHLREVQTIGHQLFQLNLRTKITFRSELFAADAEPHRYYDWPLNEGGSVTIDADGESEGELNLQSIEKGLELLAEKFPNRFVAICDEAYDAEDADVFLQLAILNEVVFG
jgi:hypothetical protein